MFCTICEDEDTRSYYVADSSRNSLLRQPKPNMETASETRFEGAGLEFHAKYLGDLVVTEAKGQEVCVESMQKIATQLKTRKIPKIRLSVHLSYSGIELKEMPPGADLSLSFKLSEISYVWKDPRDMRSLGLIRSEPNPDKPGEKLNKFYGLRTVKPAMPFLQEMQELFRIVKERHSGDKKSERTDSDSGTVPEAAKEEIKEPSSLPEQQQVVEEASLFDTDNPSSNQNDNADDPFNLKLQFDEPKVAPSTKSRGSLDDLGDIFASVNTGSSLFPPQDNSSSFNAWGSTSQPMSQAPFMPASSSQNNPMSQPQSTANYNPFASSPQTPASVPPGSFQQQFQQQPSFTQSTYSTMGGGYNPMTSHPQQVPNQQYGGFGQQSYNQPQQFGGPIGYQQGYPATSQQQFGGPMGFNQQQVPQQAPPASTNPFDNNFSSIFDRQNSTGNSLDAPTIAPVSLNPPRTAQPVSTKPADQKLFEDLVPNFGSFGLNNTGKSNKDKFEDQKRKERQTLAQMAGSRQYQQ